MRIVFMGTPDFAVPTLTQLAAGGHDIAAVYARAPKAAGRGMAERRSPVQVKAESLRLPVLHPVSLKSDAAAAAFRAQKADVVVVVAYGLLLPKPILEAPKFGCLNLHASLLPRWRGAAPIARAIMEGDTETGVAIMRMDAGLDTGPVALTERMPVPLDATAGEMHDQLAKSGADLMVRAVSLLDKGALQFTLQPEAGATYAKKLDKNETRIDWSKSAKEVHNHIRGLSPFPGAWFEIEIGKERIRVRALRSTSVENAGKPGTVLDGHLTIACGEGAVRLLEVQRAGAKAMSADEFLRGTAVAKTTVLPA
jgi:methionyl-tRNA formyltransferase